MAQRDHGSTRQPGPARSGPATLSPARGGPAAHPMLALQRSLGNRAVQRLVEGESFDAQLAGRRGSGSPLAASARAFLEPRLNADLGAVRVHTGPEAHEMAEAVNATSFATGTDLYFRDGAYNPQSEDGLRLLAHEATHVLQQARGPVAGTAAGGGIALSDPQDAFEQEADQVADAVMEGRASFANGDAGAAPADGGATPVQRQEDDDSWFGGLSSLADSASAAVSSAADTAVGFGSDVSSAVTSTAGAAMDLGADVGSAVGSAVVGGVQDFASDAGSVASAAWGGAESLASGAAGVASGAWSGAQGLASGAGDLASAAWGGAQSLASDAGELASDAWGGAQSLASGAGDLASDAWSGVKGAATAVGGGVADYASGKYDEMKQLGALVKEGEEGVGHGIDWLEKKAKQGTHWAASQAEGIPVLEQLAGAGESAVNGYIDFEGGVMKGATGMVGGLLGAVANPVDTAKGLYTMSEHLPMFGMPQKLLHGAYDMAFSDKSMGDIANQTFNPQEDNKYWGNVGSALWKPYQQAIDEGKPGEALGRGAFDIGTLLMGTGEAGAAAKVGEAAKVAEVADLAKVADVADAAKVADAAEAAKAAEAAEAAKAAEAAELANGAKTPLLPEAPSVKPLAPTELPPGLTPTELPPGFLENPHIPPPPKLPTFPEVPPGGFPEMLPPGAPGGSAAIDLVEVETQNARLEQLRDLADSGDVRGVATDPELMQAYEGAQGTLRSPVDKYSNLRNRMNTQLERGGGVVPDGDWHHWNYQEQFPAEAIDPQNLFPTRSSPTPGSAIEANVNPNTGLPYDPHTQLHQVADVPGTSRFQEMADWAKPREVRDMFNFWNAETPLGDVDELLKNWNAR